MYAEPMVQRRRWLIALLGVVIALVVLVSVAMLDSQSLNLAGSTTNDPPHV